MLQGKKHERWISTIKTRYEAMINDGEFTNGYKIYDQVYSDILLQYLSYIYGSKYDAVC